jgi:hypothetical protein
LLLSDWSHCLRSSPTSACSTPSTRDTTNKKVTSKHRHTRQESKKIPKLEGLQHMIWEEQRNDQRQDQSSGEEEVEKASVT